MMMQNAAVLLKMIAFEPLTLKKEAETIGGKSYLTAKNNIKKLWESSDKK